MAPRRPQRRQGTDPEWPRLLGERLCLDFANSIENPRDDDPQDFLHDYGDLVRWGRHVALLDTTQVERLLMEADRGPGRAAEVFTEALALRGAIMRVFTALAERSAPARPDLDVLQRLYILALAHGQLVPQDEGFAWVWDEGETRTDLGAMLWPVAASAVDLLTHGEMGRVKQCGGPEGCGWLFYDTSKNGSRRWCSMEGCGSRAKMRRYTARKRLARGRAGIGRSGTDGDDGRGGAGHALSGRDL